MNSIPRLLMAAGAVLFIVGLVWMMVGKSIPLGRLPGDIAVEKENVRFYFPIATSIVVSVALSLIWYLIRLFMK
ncbi:hypothetical protein BG53_10825 [Paenibacillus darwinianus]|uniref:DUF2905 domain-containing protein n=1 Tax=Paenibacillus darwinianus TaxID=1380763 RepID=A0A9W5RYH2_9BACL|nr:DUF2905 domain-containing protein [Paenibacillus darwinianus]EXX84604.1 hypothetical protein BG52_10380 [Paenibacillus darwinianus]EXX84636.1 hypothetical protein BG53_10825 [Paenibacillus darwinianus]EXX85376.1 hypothetical protein CH50_09645 [Paenibacillus darwinianus]